MCTTSRAGIFSAANAKLIVIKKLTYKQFSDMLIMPHSALQIKCFWNQLST